MSSFSRFFVFGLLVTIFAIAACEDSTSPEPPPPPPQIGVQYTFTKNPNPADTVTGLQSNDVFDFLVDSGGKTWVATEAGVSRYINRTGDGVFNQNNVLPHPKCRALLEHNGKVWVGTWGGGVGVYDVSGGTWSQLDADSGLVNDTVSDIEAIGDSIYISTNDGVSIYVDDDQLRMNQRWSEVDQILTPVVSVVEIARRPSGLEFWYGPRMEEMIEEDDVEDFGITVWREGFSETITYTTVNSDLKEPNINDIFYDADTDLFWVAHSTAGVASVDVSGSSWTYYTMVDHLPSNVVFSVAKVDGVIWVGTQGGVARLKPDGTWQGYGSSGGLPGDRVRRVYSNRPGDLWAGLINAGAALLVP